MKFLIGALSLSFMWPVWVQAQISSNSLFVGKIISNDARPKFAIRSPEGETILGWVNADGGEDGQSAANQNKSDVWDFVRSSAQKGMRPLTRNISVFSPVNGMLFGDALRIYGKYGDVYTKTSTDTEPTVVRRNGVYIGAAVNPAGTKIVTARLNEEKLVANSNSLELEFEEVGGEPVVVGDLDFGIEFNLNTRANRLGFRVFPGQNDDYFMYLNGYVVKLSAFDQYVNGTQAKDYTWVTKIDNSMTPDSEDEDLTRYELFPGGLHYREENDQIYAILMDDTGEPDSMRLVIISGTSGKIISNTNLLESRFDEERVRVTSDKSYYTAETLLNIQSNKVAYMIYGDNQSLAAFTTNGFVVALRTYNFTNEVILFMINYQGQVVNVMKEMYSTSPYNMMSSFSIINGITRDEIHYMIDCNCEGDGLYRAYLYETSVFFNGY